MKKAVKILIGIVVLGVAWYLVSPIWRNVEVYDPAPQDVAIDNESAGLVSGEGDQVVDSVTTSEPEPLLMLSATAESRDQALSGMSDGDVASFEEAMVGMEAKILGLVEQMPQELGPQVLAEGLFLPAAHGVKGRAEIVQHSGGTTLRFEEFQTINGPKLHIYLATDTSASDFIDLGEIRGTRGDINYEVPAGTDFEKYDTALVWCKTFGVLFSYVKLDHL